MPTPQSLGSLFATSCAKNSKDNVLIYPNREGRVDMCSYAQLEIDVAAWMNLLRSRGVKSGDRVAAISPKVPNHFRFFYACWCLGAIAVPICETLGDAEMQFIIKDSEPALILADPDMAGKVTANAGGIPVLDWNNMPDGRPGQDALRDIFTEDLDAVAALIYTSGSTGMPKGVMLTHRNLWVNARSALDVFHIDRNDRLMSLLPYWHAYALVCEVCCAIMGGCGCAIPKDIRDFRQNISAYQPSVVLVVPRIVEGLKTAIDKRISESSPRVKALVEKAIYNASRIYNAGPRLDGGLLRMVTHHLFYDPFVFRKFRKSFGGKIRCLVSGGAPLDLELQIFFKYIGLPLFQGYGLSEASPVVSTNIEENHRLGSCGPVLPWLLPENGGDFTFMDEDGNLGKGIRGGQLLVRGDCVMKGYWRHADASAKTIRDGWLNTGDIGSCDKDGFLFIQGRKGNMIVLIGGEKLHPEYVEDAVKASPMISEAMVFGEKCKNVYVAVNVPKEIADTYADPNALKKAVKAEVIRCSEHLAPFQKPKEVLILPDFSMEDGTMTATLKIRRHKIGERYRSEIEIFLAGCGEEVATKKELNIASSKVVESLDSIVLGNGNIVK